MTGQRESAKCRFKLGEPAASQVRAADNWHYQRYFQNARCHGRQILMNAAAPVMAASTIMGIFTGTMDTTLIIGGTKPNANCPQAP